MSTSSKVGLLQKKKAKVKRLGFNDVVKNVENFEQGEQREN